MIEKVLFTFLQTAWGIWWLLLHLHIRRNRNYASGRQAVSRNYLYRIVSPFLYVMQIGLCIASFWSNDPWLLKIHDSNIWRITGFILFMFGSILYAWALHHLGIHYSPCYDSHQPSEIINTGPYGWMRHPMYVSKLLIGAATIVVSGSLWFIPTTVYFWFATIKVLIQEDRQLKKTIPGYIEYCAGTTMILPWII